MNKTRFYGWFSSMFFQPAFVGLLCLVACASDNLEDDRMGKIEFEIVTLSESGLEQTTFGNEEDIQFGIRLINNSGKDFEWRNDYSCMLMNADEFLVSYKKGAENSGEYFRVGSPYAQPVNCLAINIAMTWPPGESIITKLPWSTNPDNAPLTIGEYYARSYFSLNINGSPRTWELKKDYQVK